MEVTGPKVDITKFNWSTVIISQANLHTNNIDKYDLDNDLDLEMISVSKNIRLVYLTDEHGYCWNIQTH